MKPVYLLIGVPASGKTYVAERLTDKFNYVANDDYIGKDLVAAVVKAASGSKPVLVDCPFGETELRRKLEAAGLEVRPCFIVETPTTVNQRYQTREGKSAPNSTIARAATMRDKAKEWNAPHGTSAEILKMLRAEKV